MCWATVGRVVIQILAKDEKYKLDLPKIENWGVCLFAWDKDW